ncbi:MAG TPA: HAD-IIB family hydrolase [Candidatus Saccharimonadales bacterium]|nr:HAD-IIB family hydrolase [Candidatus Saccharimonadales bacterium]
MKKYKALLVDFDGTIASGIPGDITTNLQFAIKKIINNGYIFSIVTGRPYFGRIKEVCQELDLKSPQIAYGGAEIRDPKNDGILWAKYLKDTEASGIINYFLKNNIYFVVEKDDFLYTPDGKQALYISSFTVKDVKEAKLYNIPKIVLPSTINQFSEAKLESIIDDLQTLYKDLHIIKGKIGEFYGLDITAGGANKHISVLEYSKLLNLKQEEIIGVGDNYNDFPLLTACGLKVAMGDAPKELKDIADLIVPTQQEDGLLTVIETYLL